MMDRVVQVPSALLLDREVPATARLLWMVAQLRPEAGVTELSQMSGLSRTTIYAGIYQLAARGWDPKAGLAPGASGRTARTAVPTPGLTGPTRGATIPVPAALLTDHRLQPFSRILYGLLLLTPGYCYPRGRFTYEQLAGLAHASRNSVASAVGQLTRAEWICAERAHRLAPISFELTFPGLSRGLAALDAAQERLSRADPYGEGIMREYLSLLIDSENYEDNAEPRLPAPPQHRGSPAVRPLLSEKHSLRI